MVNPRMFRPALNAYLPRFETHAFTPVQLRNRQPSCGVRNTSVMAYLIIGI